MNRIYRRIWNATRRCWVVASELSSPRGKPAQTRVLMSALLLTVASTASAANHADDAEVSKEEPKRLEVQKERIVLMSAPPVNAMASAPISPRGLTLQMAMVTSGNYADAVVSGQDTLALGSRARISGTESTALGNYAETSSGYATAVGHYARAFGGHSTAMGTKAYANGKGATALGHDSQASAGNAIAVGSGSRASYTDSVAIGANSVTYASSTVSVGASGRERRITNVREGTNGTDAVNVNQLGNTNRNVANVESIANTARSTANSAKSSADSALAKANIREGLLNQSSSSSTVRLGGSNSGALLDIRNSNSGNRKITGIADGQISTSSVEAVNGRQLNSTHQLATRGDATATAAMRKADATTAQLNGVSLALGQGASADSTSGTAVGGSAIAGEYAVALGYQSLAKGKNAVALGNLARASAGSSTAVGDNSQAYGAASTAVGTSAQAGGSGAASYGYAAKALGDYSLAFGAFANASHAGSIALGKDATTTGVNQISVGNKDVQRKIVSMADGLVAKGSTEAVTGNQLFDTHATATSAKTAADAAVAQAKNSAYLLANGTLGNDTTKAKATGTGALANGIYTEASGTAATAVGRTAKAMADGAIAIGDRVKIESATSKNSIAIGSFATTGPQEDLMAIGRNANASGAVGAMALGVSSSASHLRSVALGSGSVTTAQDQVSVGSTAIKRRIVNLANGALSATSNEAVTGAQLFATDKTARDAEVSAKGAVVAADSALSKAKALEGLIQQTTPTGVVRLGAENEGVILNVNNKSGKQRTITGIAAGALSQQSSEAVTGSQLYGTNLRVGALEGLVREDAPVGSVRLGGNNTGSVLDVRNKSDGKRKISGVADGALVTGSADAVTGGQLAATNASVAGAEKLISDVATRVEATSRHIAVGAPIDDEKAQAGRLGIAIGDSAFAAPTKDGAVALGSYSRAEGEDSVALGRAAWVQENASRGFALGSRSAVEEADGLALGASSQVVKGAQNAVAIGSGSAATESSAVSFGNDVLKRRLTNLARGTADHNATTVGQLNDTLATLGGGAKLDATGNVTAPTYTVQNTRQHTVGDALTILDGAVLRTTSRMDRVEGQLRSVFQDSPATRADGLNQIALAGANGMILSNVGNGLIAAGSRDAVNGGQLHSMQQQLNGRMDGLEQRIDGQPQSRMMALASDDAGTPASTPVVEEPTSPASKDDKVAANTGNAPKALPQPKAEAPESPKPQVDTAELEKMLARANDYSDGIAREVDARLNKMDKRFNRMAAMSSAQTAMAMNTAGLATYNRLGAGVGYAEGESAMAVGYQRVLNEKGSATFSLNGAFTNSGERSMGVGVGIGW